MKIRKAQLHDSEVLAALCITVWIDTYCFEGIEPAHASYVLTEFTPEKLSKRIESKAVYVAELGDLIVGVSVLDEETFEIETLYVLPRFTGKGAGRLLISELKKHTSSGLFLTCWEGNMGAREFYGKLGFVESGEAFFELDGKRIRNVELRNS